MATALNSPALAQSPETLVHVVSIFPVSGGAAAYDLSDKKLKFFELQESVLKEVRRIPVEHTVWGVSDLNAGYIVASGYGRGALDAPLRLTWFAKDGSVSRVVFEKPGERSQVTYFQRIGEKLWITFFDSKYVTKTGYFQASDKEPWSFIEKLSFRLGDAVDVAGETIAVGRPYGDIQGQDGDLAIYIDGVRNPITTYRGVRAVTLIGDPKAPDVLAADGWHQNYGQFAQGRVTLARRDSTTGQYASQLIDLDTAQYGFSRFIDFKIGSKSYVAALGNKALQVYSPSEGWKKTVIYTRTSEDFIFDVALLEVGVTTASFLVANNGLHVASFP
jgi:hypothetical protein